MGDLRFDDQVAVVTGAGRGLGRAYAMLLAARGARVVVNDLGGSVTGDGSGEGPAAAAAREIAARGGEAVPDTHTVATPEGGRAVIDTALDAWGRVDILVNNAGTVDPAPFEDITDDRLRGLIDVHLKGAFFVTRPAWKVMRSRGYGRVVNTCSAAGIFGAQRMANYGAAKTGLIGFTRVLAAESAGTDITVNAIAPIAATRMLDHSLSDVTDPVQRTAVDEVMAPFLDALDPALVAPVVAFLAHRDCPVNGEIFTVGGGHVAQFFIGRTRGYRHPNLSIEDVRAHLDEIKDRTDYTVPSGPADEMAQLYEALTASG
ncbi:SDR family NAD(P)-dependent oxidoreductase [Mycolicibacterium litorale]|uniref:Short-chain dehydrogenase n=1 Tax=Mycolicibacterium litorale TaxID=758802 RepID=A0AAD1IIR7_9MYCO|nr:SDR family NAD(P)-dependent oxidoreductase [Mycolicibacterium litorale]MCV7414161.1 SDR family NAD(P)-dependent oxidoreductase [Mycolicibacterium litorale]TDY02147.1 NAD(P)-dependent dehydrogenase (short-subunit alcohol dehydrogenase family) [Mycolicibacterium litorale]BBY15651.1 short-chain dehydrogenase [Mycolicibacterium litorale]